MTADRWQQVSRLFHAALEREASGRDRFLLEACAGDESLRQEVSSLLAQPISALSDPPLLTDDSPSADNNSPASIKPGGQLGVYEIRSELGAGGMGVVYLAHDPRLERRVAIKVLPAAFASNPARLLRFEQEARAAAALN